MHCQQQPGDCISRSDYTKSHILSHVPFYSFFSWLTSWCKTIFCDAWRYCSRSHSSFSCFSRPFNVSLSRPWLHSLIFYGRDAIASAWFVWYCPNGCFIKTTMQKGNGQLSSFVDGHQQDYLLLLLYIYMHIFIVIYFFLYSTKYIYYFDYCALSKRSKKSNGCLQFQHARRAVAEHYYSIYE